MRTLSERRSSRIIQQKKRGERERGGGGGGGGERRKIKDESEQRRKKREGGQPWLADESNGRKREERPVRVRDRSEMRESDHESGPIRTIKLY